MSDVVSRPKGAGYEAWLEQIKAKYPDARTRTEGAHGSCVLGCTGEGVTFTPTVDGLHYTEVSSDSYSKYHLIGRYYHNTDTGEIFVSLD